MQNRMTDTFARPESLPKTGAVRELESQLSGISTALSRKDGARSLSGLIHLLKWLRHSNQVSLGPKAPLSGKSPSARLWLLNEYLRENPELAERIGNRLEETFATTDAVGLFCDTGLSSRHGFFHEVLARFTGKLLPTPANESQFSDLVRRMFPTSASVDWAKSIPMSLIDDLTERLFPATDDAPFDLLKDDIADALNILAGRVCSLGLQEDVRLRSGEIHVRTSPFLNLPKITLKVVELALPRPTEAGNGEEFAENLLAWTEEVSRCRTMVQSVFDHLEEFGIGVDLVFRLELITHQLDRMERLMSHLIPETAEHQRRRRIELFLHLIRESIADRSVTAVVRSNIHHLSRKIIESAGAVGEHYITATRKEYWEMMRSALGGGMLTAGTTMVKYAILTMPMLPLFLEGTLTSLNYAVSFLLIQFFGFTLATKQPAATAATLAGSLNRLRGEHNPAELVELIARTTRSQLAAFIGNLVMVIPVVLVLDRLWKTVTGHPYLTPTEAEHVFHITDPLHSLTIPFAFLTGILLWASTLAGGWLENWFSYHRISDAIRQDDSNLPWLSRARKRGFASWLRHNIAGIGSNASLGVLLGMTGVVGKFFGLPLDVRHVTLSTGALALAGSSLGIETLSNPNFPGACFGILVIGTLNFTVSFSLALLVAARATGVRLRDFLQLPGAISRAMWEAPSRFFLPPTEKEPVRELK